MKRRRAGPYFAPLSDVCGLDRLCSAAATDGDKAVVGSTVGPDLSRPPPVSILATWSEILEVAEVMS